MKKLLFFLIIFTPFVFSQTYSEDKAEIYMANNEVEETLNTANNILCIISKLKQSNLLIKDLIKLNCL